MTENENSVKVAIIGSGRSVGRTIREQMELLVRMDELEAYRAIGTVDEFKALKECTDCSATVKWINKNRILVNDMEFIDATECYKEIRAMAIDEFAEALKEKAEEIMQNPDIMLDCKKCTVWKLKDIDEIAEQMKEGAE